MTGWDWNRESLVLELINSAKCNSLDYQFVPNDPDTQVRDLRNGNDVFGPAAVKIVKPGVIGRLVPLVGAVHFLVHLAEGRKCLSVFHSFRRKYGNLVAVDFDGLLRG